MKLSQTRLTVFVVTLLQFAFVICSLSEPAAAQKCKTYKAKPRKAACLQFKKFADCPDQGCGDTGNADLNERKNIRTADLTTAQNKSFEPLRKKKKPAGYTVGGDRGPLTAAGEGDVVTTIAWLTNIRSGSQESCNCYFSKPIDTDNHMVLLNDYVINHYKPKDWEKHSFTAEFTPRVKQNGHGHFQCDRIRPLILGDPRGRLWVRLTGTLLFDGFHEVHPLANGRETNWEIHPVFRFEYCPWPNKCTLANNDGWVDIDD